MLNLIRQLEAEAVQIIRETFNKCERVGLLFSGGKDSTVLLHLCRKALFPFKRSFDLVHIDSGHNFPEVGIFVEQSVKKYGQTLKVGRVSDLVAADPNFQQLPKDKLQSYALKKVLSDQGYQAVLGGGRRDEDKARSKEHIFSRRDKNGLWNSNDVDPDIYPHWSSLLAKDEHFRIFPISNWTERDIWKYIAEEKLNVVPLYYSHKRKCLKTKEGTLLTFAPVNVSGPAEVKEVNVRFRSLGDIENSIAFESECVTPQEVMIENMQMRTMEHIPFEERKFNKPLSKKKLKGYS